jgi:hypothetical protein
MIKLLKRLFGTRRAINQVEEFFIDDNMPSTVAGLNYKDVLKVKGYLERLRVGQSYPIELKLEYAVRQVAREQFPHYKISVRKVGGNFKRVFRLA